MFYASVQETTGTLLQGFGDILCGVASAVWALLSGIVTFVVTGHTAGGDRGGMILTQGVQDVAEPVVVAGWASSWTWEMWMGGVMVWLVVVEVLARPLLRALHALFRRAGGSAGAQETSLLGRAERGMTTLGQARAAQLSGGTSLPSDRDLLAIKGYLYLVIHGVCLIEADASSVLGIVFSHVALLVGVLAVTWVRGVDTTGQTFPEETAMDRYVRGVAFLFWVAFVDVLWLVWGFDNQTYGQIQYLTEGSLGQFLATNVTLTFGLDGVGLLFLMLSVFIANFCLFMLDHPTMYGVAAVRTSKRVQCWLPGWMLGIGFFIQSVLGISSSVEKTTSSPTSETMRPVVDVARAVSYDEANVQQAPLYCLLLAVMYAFLLVFFTTADLLVFFFAYEGVLVPMGLFIVVFGSRREKKQALFYFCVYTLVGSLPLLYGIFSLGEMYGTTNLLGLYVCDIPESVQRTLWLCFFVPFAVKVPMVPVHLWLPEAHVEASTTGSVLLAALLLKLGIYGLIRFNVTLLPAGSVFFRPLVYMVCALGVVYVSLIIFRQLDLKKYVAYTSIVHMNMCVAGLFSGSLGAYASAVFLAFTHGFVSTAMFFLIGVLYKRYKDRSVLYYRGLEVDMPVVSFFFFLFSLANCSFPGSPGFIGEFLLLAGLAHTGNMAVVLVMLVGVFFSILYSLLFYVRIFWSSALPVYGQAETETFHRTPTPTTTQLQWVDATRHETYLLGLLAGLTVAVGFYPNFFLGLARLCVHLPAMGL